jgi:phosphate transport system protein
MYRDLLNIWKGSGLLRLCIEDLLKMFDISESMFSAAWEMITGSGKVEDLYRIDRHLNELQIAIRRRILEHLAVNPAQDINATFVLSILVIDLERIGDYAKNLDEIATHCTGDECGLQFKTLEPLAQRVKQMFSETKKALTESDAELARRIMQDQADMAMQADRLMDQLIESTDISVKEGIVAALMSRYLKRVSAHLKNVASSVVNPYHRIGYRPNEKED